MNHWHRGPVSRGQFEALVTQQLGPQIAGAFRPIQDESLFDRILRSARSFQQCFETNASVRGRYLDVSCIPSLQELKIVFTGNRMMQIEIGRPRLSNLQLDLVQQISNDLNANCFAEPCCYACCVVLNFGADLNRLAIAATRILGEVFSVTDTASVWIVVDEA